MFKAMLVATIATTLLALQFFSETQAVLADNDSEQQVPTESPSFPVPNWAADGRNW